MSESIPQNANKKWGYKFNPKTYRYDVFDEGCDFSPRRVCDANESDFRLVVSAPDMFKILKRILHNPEARIGGEMRAEVVAAISKAEGK